MEKIKLYDLKLDFVSRYFYKFLCGENVFFNFDEMKIPKYLYDYFLRHFKLTENNDTINYFNGELLKDPPNYYKFSTVIETMIYIHKDYNFINDMFYKILNYYDIKHNQD